MQMFRRERKRTNRNCLTRTNKNSSVEFLCVTTYICCGRPIRSVIIIVILISFYQVII